jgi:hypothetical protein
VKHAGPQALERLEPILAELRKLAGLKEKSRGVFYRGSAAFLHFHEDPAGFFADIRLDGADFVRLPVNSRTEAAALLRKTRKALAD